MAASIEEFTWMSNVFAAAFLGGGESPADELENALASTLPRLKDVAEAA